MEIPNELKNFIKEGRSILLSKGIGDILFSEGTYEVEVKDEKSTYFPFIQIKDNGKLVDAFCSCDEQEEEGLCKHIAAGYLQIFAKHKLPLHLFFRSSFWKSIFVVIAEKAEFDFKEFVYRKSDKDTSEIYTLSNNNRNSCEIEVTEPSLKKKIKQIYESDKNDIEESIKFSSLSFEDISLMKKGRIRKELEFELSFFSDIAKEVFFLNEHDKDYKIEFSPINESLPTQISISFSSIKIRLQLEYKDFKVIIPALGDVDSPLGVFDFEKHAIEAIIYDRQSTCFDVDVKQDVIDEIELLRLETNKSIDQWLFIPSQGFLSKDSSPFFDKNKIQKNDITGILQKYTSLFEKYLKNEKFNSDPKKPKYHLFIDDNNALHIRPYIFEKEELFKPYSRFFGPWVYIEDKGFYIFEDLIFNAKEKIVLADNVSEFVNNFRTWLQNINGFETHFGNFEEEFIFYLNEDNDLKFETKVKLPEGLEGSINFGNWVYLKDKGFYSKKEQASLPLIPQNLVKYGCIEDYIIENKEDLKQIPNFFIQSSPLKDFGVKIHLNENLNIEIIPEKILSEGVKPEDLVYFDHFIYVKNKGFFELPFNFRIPKEYQEKKEIDSTNETFFIEYELNRLKPFIVLIDNCLQTPRSLKIKVESLKKYRGSYLAELYYISELGKIAATDLFFALQKKKRYIFTKAGLIDTQEARFNWLRDISIKKVLEKKKMFKFAFLEWLRLSVFEDVKRPRGKSSKALKTAKIFDELQALHTDIPLDISLLKAELRSYQESGVKWLWFLYSYGLSGLLCDEMGLGKTHQTMALIAAVAANKPNMKYLVICPTSVIYHWEELLKKFLPDFKVCTFHGSSRELEEEYDILLTSYGIARSDNKKITSIKFELAIFDEAQIAKNHTSKTHKALKKIRSKMLIGLTGTPIENRIRELKSLFDLILPNYLPSEAQFQEFFINPIEKENDSERKIMLSKLIKPFILRRKKQEVLLDLPEKIEEILYCDLLEDQKELYYDTAFVSKKSLITDLKDKEKPVKYVHVFSLLSKLKQICDHPILINKDIDNYKSYHSGKWELFKALLSEALESDQKVVIFTQYLGMIKIMGKYLEEKNISFASITGSTKDRKEQIHKFKDDPKCTVFLASLLAAGVGIDLTCASIVFHYDRWWNPAKENQATDRVHRIGQNRGVQVIKFVTKNTIEERIHELIEMKQGLIDETIGKDDSDQIKTLSRDDLISILQDLKVVEE